MLNKIIDNYKSLINETWEPSIKQKETLSSLIDYALNHNYPISSKYKKALIEAINQKLDLNKESYRLIIDEAFHLGIKLNYQIKLDIYNSLNNSNKEYLETSLKSNGILDDKLIKYFKPVKTDETLNSIQKIKEDPKKLDIFSSIFSRYCFNLFPLECSHNFFSNEENSEPDFLDFIERKYPKITDRSNTFNFIDIDNSIFKNSYSEGISSIFNIISKSYETLNNYCYLGIYIPPIKTGDDNIQWDIYKDVILFAEKHIEEPIDKVYFRWKKISEITENYIGCNIKTNWEHAFQGFVFKDCFIMNETNSNHPYSLLLLLEKDYRDERVINCPACRSSIPQGNSYPILNVKSWECENPLCPDKSKYNRGKRYSLISLLKQKELNNEDNKIPLEFISKWHLDCVYNVSFEDIFELCIRHYSYVNDGIIIYTNRDKNNFTNSYNRNIYFKEIPIIKHNLLSEFANLSYFNRYLIRTNEFKKEDWRRQRIHNSLIINGNSLHVLHAIKDNTFTAAVTSPPYYNAKEYSQWPNIYCYLYDMYNISIEIYRTLKTGGVYLFNIFDYFDNENNIVLSAMGKKRMILGPYMLDIFKRIGFKIIGNIIWNKGEIQGNRSFNQGNLTPYYQAPLNCWEHIFILSKGEIMNKFKPLKSAIEEIQPVIKIIKGKNTYGHTAPYPVDIPNLVAKLMDPKDVLLDPFLGSGTTCISAENNGIKSIGIELNEDYYNLSISKVQKICNK